MLTFERGGLPVFILHSEIPVTLGFFAVHYKSI